MNFAPHYDAQMYMAGFGNADTALVIQSAAITAILFALASAVAALIMSNKKKK